MPNENPNTAASAEALKRNHESRDPSLAGILFGAGMVALLLAMCLAIVAFIMSRFSRARPVSPMPYAGAIVAPDDAPLREFPTPQLQINPRLELEALRAREAAELTTYGWIDRDAGTLRIPIHRAMELLLERGLPARETNQPVPVGKSSLELLHDRSQGR
jgi:hypothetical protein